MSLLRRLKKLKKMSGSEISCRISGAARRWQDQYAYRGRAMHRRRPTSDSVARGLARQAARLIPGSSLEQLQQLKSTSLRLFDELAGRAASRAAQIVNGRYAFLGFQADLTGNIDWHKDPRSAYRWPRDFYASLDLYELPDGVDVKYVWELNRHQFLVELAHAWMFTRDARFAGRARELLLDWINCNPLYEGVNWTSALEAAVRGISWLWTLAGLAEWDGWQPGDFPAIAQSLADHAQYLTGHLSFYSSPYNHLIGEAAGLFILGSWLDGVESASLWRMRGRDVLLEHGPRQFYRDGFCVEQATGYHFFTLGFLAHAVVAGQAAGDPIEGLQPTLANAFRAAAAFMQPNGLWPAVGDVDSARAIPAIPENFWDFKSLYSLGTVLGNCRELAQVAQEPGAELYWLSGLEGVQKFIDSTAARQSDRPSAVERPSQARLNAPDADKTFSQASAADGRRVSVLSDAGYAIVRSGSASDADWVLLDGGPIADGLFADATPSTAHGHADALQVLLCLRGQPILCDSGIPFYFGSREWVDHFRSAAAHNTIEIEGRPVARHAGRLGWSHVCGSMHLGTNDTPHGPLVWGKVELDSSNSMTRTVLLIPGRGVWIGDLVQTDQPRLVQWYWQVPQAAAMRICGLDGTTSALAGQDLVMTQWGPAGAVKLQANTGNASGPRGWQASAYGTRVAGCAIGSQQLVNGESLFITYFGFEAANSNVRSGKHSLRCMAPGVCESSVTNQIDLSLTQRQLG